MFTTEYDIPSMERILSQLHSLADEARGKIKLWRRLFFLSLFSLVLFAILAFITKLLAVLEWLSAVSIGCMFFSFGFTLFSMNRQQIWVNHAELWSDFMRPMEMRLYSAYEAQNASAVKED